MSDPFFIKPGRGRKRPANQISGKPGVRRNGLRTNGSTRTDAKSNGRPAKLTAPDSDISSDESISVSEAEAEESHTDSDDEEEYANETEADKRRRLAKQYLENLQQEVTQEGFDAKDLDREIIARRLRTDVAENQGKIFRFLTEEIKGDYFNKTFPLNKSGINACATLYPHSYTVSKDLVLAKYDISGRNPRRVRWSRGKSKAPEGYKGHISEILCVAVSPDGAFVVTGGKDHRIVVWNSESLTVIKVFDTRDRLGVVTGLAFRRGTNELYASCADLKVRTYNLDQLAQIETLFGHQDMVADISALGQEKCVTVGSRDRSAVLWKISEETRLTFRGGGEGSIDCCSMIDDQYFVTGSDNGNICLWSIFKKKPIHVIREAHGKDKPMAQDLVSGETDSNVVPAPEPQACFITSIYSIPYSNIFFSGSWNGEILIWRLTDDQSRKIEKLGSIHGATGVVTRITVAEQGPKGKENYTLVASMSKEMKMGRWLNVKGRNGLFICQLNPSAKASARS